MTVLLVIALFAVCVSVDYILIRRRERRAAVSVRAVAEPPMIGTPLPEPVWVGGYRLRTDVHYHRGHTWARVLDDDTVQVGLDDFARRLLEPAGLVEAPVSGSLLGQGDRAFRVRFNGRSADFVSPVEGEVMEVNSALAARPALATDDPYGQGWILRMKVPQLASNLRSLLSGDLARRWMEDTSEKLELHLMALSGTVLQDGGKPISDFARHLSEEDWRVLVRKFLLT